MGSARTGSNPVGVANLLSYPIGFMAEWSKALDSSSSLHLKAWVRIPLEPPFVTTIRGPVAQWIARLTSNQAVVGSSPTGVGLLASNGGLAQSVECVVCNDEAPGSKPGFSIFCIRNVAPWPSG